MELIDKEAELSSHRQQFLVTPVIGREVLGTEEEFEQTYEGRGLESA